MFINGDIFGTLGSLFGDERHMTRVQVIAQIFFTKDESVQLSKNELDLLT